jgi:PAS domain S-box-containing protein
MSDLSQRIKQNESILRSIINSALDAVIVIDERGIITEWNSQAEQTFGWDRNWVIGKRLSDTIIPTEYREAHERGMKHFLKTGEGPVLNKRIEITAVDSKGRVFPVELTIIPNKVDGVFFFSSFVRDITEAKKSERTLKAINDLAISLLGKNHLDEIAWEITQNTIEVLGLEDCVIYVVDEKDGGLHQVAAYGPKNPDGFEIANRISLAIGEGIVGRAAQLKQPVLVNNTQNDASYKVDDASRLSELAVPIIYEDQIIGVIDSEHPDVDFYQKEHVDVFTTIANITSSKINSAITSKKRAEAEKSLKESEERWQNLVENMPEAIQISKNGEVIYMNPAGLRLYEADSIAQVKGVNLRDLSDNLQSNVFDERMELLRRYGFVDPIEFEITTFKGTTKFIEANSNTIHYNGELAIQSVLRDITEKKKTERDLVQLSSRLSTLLDNLNTGVLMEQADRKVVHANSKFCDLFGNIFSPDDLMGQDCGELLIQAKSFFKDPEYFTSSTNQLVSENSRSVNEELDLVNGKILERDFIPIIYDGIQYGTVWQYRDITSRKENEQELVRALEAERSYNELNKNFVSMVSHEFRTPLTSIQSTAELLLTFSDRFTLDDIKKRVDRIHQSSIRMDQLIEDVLTIGKLEANNNFVNNEEFKLSSVLQETIEMLQMSELSGREVIIEGLSDEPMMYCDVRLMELIFRNILENAAKYSEQDKPIRISTEFSQTHAHIQCIDLGIGIPPKEQKHIFESFKRASNTEGIKGTGLGLAIVKKSVDRLNGTIGLSSVIDEGTTISLELPIKNSKTNSEL